MGWKRSLLVAASALQAALFVASLSASKVLEIDGDLQLAALFPIHKRGLAGRGHACGEIQKEDGIQPLEALLFTLDEINADEMLLPGIKLGLRVMDSCDNPYHASEKALSLLDGFMARKANLTCGGRAADGACDDKVVGLIGPQTSPASVQIATIGRLFHVPQISYLSTSVALCNRQDFPYFFRTVPSDVHQARVILDILYAFKWNYASIVHSDSDYGEMGYQALSQHVQRVKKHVCLADPIVIYNDHFLPEDYDDVVRKLFKNTKSRVVVVFADRIPAGKLLEAANRLGVPRDYFVWIGSDAWASRESVVEDREEVASGAIAVQPLRRHLPGYSDYFSRLVYEPNPRNPWFDEYLRRYHNCSNEAGPELFCNRTVGGRHNRHALRKSPQQPYMHFIRDAAYAFAHALHDLHAESCSDFEAHRLCPEFKRRVFRDLKGYVANVSFYDVAGRQFRFFGHDHVDGPMFRFFGRDRHDGPPRYSIINFQQSSADPGMWDWADVGTYYSGIFSEMEPGFRRRFEERPSVECLRLECNKSEIIVQDTEDLCCWHCIRCTELQYKYSDFECRTCPLGEHSDGENRTSCELMPESYLDYSDRWAIGSMAFAAVGIVFTLVTAGVFWGYWDTPVVKACGRELSIMLLVGTFISFLTTFAIVAKPTTATCGTMRFCIGFAYTVCYSAVVTKTSRVSRIFGAANRNPRYTSPLACVVIACSLVSVELIINLVWLVVEPPSTKHIATPNGKRILVCVGVDDSFMAGLVYPFMLIICATLYAFKTRKCPGGFNETRYIFFANTLTCIHWVAYVPLYMASSDHEIRAVILAYSLSLSGIVQLACMLFPKLYTVLFKPEKNTRGAVMTTHRSRSCAVAETPPNSAAAEYVMVKPTAQTEVRLTSAATAGTMTVIVSSGGAMPMANSMPDITLSSSPSRFVASTATSTSSSREWAGGGGMLNRRRRSSSVCRSTQTPTCKRMNLSSNCAGNDHDEEDDCDDDDAADCDSDRCCVEVNVDPCSDNDSAVTTDLSPRVLQNHHMLSPVPTMIIRH